MFRCAITGKMSRPGEKVNKIITESRNKIYYGWFRNEETGRFEQHEVGHGLEIVAEVNASEEGLRLWTQAQQQVDKL